MQMHRLAHRLRYPNLPDLEPIPISQARLSDALQSRALARGERQNPGDDGGHDRLCGATGAVVAFNRNTEPSLRQRGAINALRAGLHEDALTEQLHDIGTNPAGAGDKPWRARASLPQPQRGPRP